MPAVRSWGLVGTVAAVLSVIVAALQLGRQQGGNPDDEARQAPRHRAPAAERSTTADIHKISHVVVIMQENRSFDT